ncbi:MAG: hypothetical protein OEV40_24850 [Acidimicrobiia bacterium]|nr:hypothetical protein [Acidimicrobiia bacterium]
MVTSSVAPASGALTVVGCDVVETGPAVVELGAVVGSVVGAAVDVASVSEVEQAPTVRANAAMRAAGHRRRERDARSGRCSSASDLSLGDLIGWLLMVVDSFAGIVF